MHAWRALSVWGVVKFGYFAARSSSAWSTNDTYINGAMRKLVFPGACELLQMSKISAWQAHLLFLV